MRSKIVTLALAGAALLAGPAASAASEQVDTRSVSVSYADLNLENPKDQAILERRLSRAARQLCRSREDRSAQDVRAANDCYRLAMQRNEVVLATLKQQSNLGG